ncbi:isochorismatase [Microdochium trichocladiopsis]|uniref:Isochorismatase n=1 Tax=Microdochium trichocladiopsis TaxID=1682393 RepID=A0A9P8XU57_9PEZI|nr:isochorismatase [Microdochium trichocladiopsis]KAH7014389.1 isochorismatase [Microdochium trichocladiopsis]
MNFSVSTLLIPLVALASAWEQIDKENALVAIVDVQVGLFSLVRDFDPVSFRNSIHAHADLAKTFGLPVVLTTSAQSGPNGPMSSEILDMFPDVKVIQRNGEINAWDNAEFREAVEKSGKKQIIIAGIATDVCTTFLALSLKEAGYSVWANAEASGTTTEFVRSLSNDRMARAGVNVVSWFAIAADLLRDWRSPDAPRMIPFFDRWMPAYGAVARAHLGAVNNGTVFPGEDEF